MKALQEHLTDEAGPEAARDLAFILPCLALLVTPVRLILSDIKNKREIRRGERECEVLTTYRIQAQPLRSV